LASETLGEIVALALDIERGGESLPAEARVAYLEAKQSIIDARRAGERLGS
jgi:hypothetical protein